MLTYDSGYEVHEEFLSSAVGRSHDRFIAQTQLLFCLPHARRLARLDQGSKDRIGREAEDRLVGEGASQDSFHHLPASHVAFRDGFLEEFDQCRPHLGAMPAHGAICPGHGVRSCKRVTKVRTQDNSVHTCSMLDLLHQVVECHWICYRLLCAIRMARQKVFFIYDSNYHLPVRFHCLQLRKGITKHGNAPRNNGLLNR